MHALHQVLHAFFNLHSFTLAMPDVWAGFQVNLRMMFVAEALVLAFALAIAVVRGLPGRGAKPLRALAIAYTDFFRGTPIIVVAFFVGFGLPGLQLGFISNRSFTTYGIVTLTLVYTAYVAEVYRAGIESVHPSQRAAARSLGLSYAQSMRYVVVPQAVRRVIPPLLNDFIGLQKDTAIVSVIGVAEAASLSQQFSTQNGDFVSYLVAAIFFILITIPLARFTDHLVLQRERKERALAF
ncbi:MAG: polar amino acid transport system permease protein [Actinomycetota bacterium]|jgi:polar amino acid transport system permease protein